jgi:hypothetical protein
MANLREWLQAERNGQDELAERLFARSVAEISPIEPAADFAGRAAQAAWRARARHRAVVRLVRVAAALLLGVTTLGSLYAVVASGLVARTAVVLSHGLAWLLTSAGEGLRWWWIAERIGTAVGGSLASSSTAMVIVAIETAALLALYAFQRLFQNELQPGESRKVRS